MNTIAINPTTRDTALSFSLKVSENTHVNDVLETAIEAKEVVQVSVLSLYLAVRHVVGPEAMNEFPRLGSTTDRESPLFSDNPEIYTFPAKNDKGETISKTGNYYADYVENFPIVKLSRSELETSKARKDKGELDDIAYGRIADKMQSRITSAKSLARRMAGLHYQLAAVREMDGWQVFLDTKTEDGALVPAGSTKPITVIYTPKSGDAKPNMKNVAVSTFLSWSVPNAKKSMANGKDAFEALVTSGAKRKPTDPNASNFEVKNVGDFENSLYSLSDFMEEHATAIHKKLTDDIRSAKNKSPNYELLETVFDLEKQIRAITTSPQFATAYQKFLAGLADQAEAA